ncbi:MAG: hypothetical protein H0X04_07510 [Chthoniobacterales bacterium]|nr:hypothetical protein [Chthoniobacterales bacterium]
MPPVLLAQRALAAAASLARVAADMGRRRRRPPDDCVVLDRVVLRDELDSPPKIELSRSSND